MSVEVEVAELDVAALYKKLCDEIGKVVIGQPEVLRHALAVFLSSGHALLEGMPGTAKTLLVRALSSCLDMRYNRVQMTPDLLPGDICGSSIYREDTHEFHFRPGPVFTNFLLADEINRASAKTQSALLESMQELTVTYDGKIHLLPEPFMVFATQNPIEQEGTYPLPLAQLDRFMFKIIVDYPSAEHEDNIYQSHHATGFARNLKTFGVQKVVSPEDIVAAREVIRSTYVREEIAGYVRRLMQATREDEDLQVGGSPRAGLMLLMGAKGLARFEGRDFVVPDDIKEAFLPAMRHRVVLSPSAELEGQGADEALLNILERVEVPR